MNTGIVVFILQCFLAEQGLCLEGGDLFFVNQPPNSLDRLGICRVDYIWIVERVYLSHR